MPPVREAPLNKNNRFYTEASTITNVMKKVAQMEAQPDTRRDILKMLSVNLNNVYSDLLTGNPVNQSHIDQAIAAKSNFAQLSSILTSLLGKKI